MTPEEDKKYEQESERLNAELKPLLTDEFLQTLVKAARTHGWMGDFIEVHSFVKELFVLAGKEKEFRDFEPFQDP